MSKDPKDQFNAQAEFYANSKVHSSGQNLEIISDYLENKRFDLSLDIATGTGFTAFESSKVSKKVLALDIAIEMINQAKTLAKEKSINNIQFVIASADNLPYKNSYFDLITCRTGTHHFENFEKSLKEMHRTLKDNGTLIISDTITSQDNDLSSWHQKVEIMRDPSHQSNYSIESWKELFNNLKFEVTKIILTSVKLTLDDWMTTSGTPPDIQKKLRKIWVDSDSTTRKYFKIKEKDNQNFKFEWPCAVM
ncbi:MAG TPA: methyltransferase domain-containing protein, partial [Dehalococcoidia bacterium]|nr:methyltransferase domain-containing protein [Dehalococcoidia bacterium]